MRIALVSQEYPPETAHGGIGTQTYLKARGLAGLGHDVHVISHSLDERVHVRRSGRIEVIRIPNVDREFDIRTDAARALCYSAQVARALEALHARVSLDVVDVPDYGAEGYVYLQNRVPWNAVPVALHLHGPTVMLGHTLGWPDMESESYRQAVFMESACVRLADAVVSSSACSADWAAAYCGVDRASIRVLHTGVDTSHFRPPADARPARPTIVFTGKIQANKGVELLVDAACVLAGDIPGLRLKLAGSGDEQLECRLRDRAAVYPGLLELAGFVPHERLPAFLASGDVFAAPSIYEGGPGFVYLEAMACGLPVVACAGSGASEVVTHGETGLLVDPADLSSLVDALRMLLSQPDHARSMGRQARRYVETEADSPACLRRFEAFYMDLAHASVPV